MTWISARVPGSSIESPQYTPPGATLGISSTQPLSNFFGTLAAAQAFYPNAGITALTQETDRAALAQLFHDSTYPRLRAGATYQIDAVGANPLVFAQQYGCIEGAGALLQAVGTSGNWGVGGPGGVIKYTGYHLGDRNLNVDGGCYSSVFNFLLNGPLTGNGAFHGKWYQGCADSWFIGGNVQNCLSYGHWCDDTGGGVADFCHFISPGATKNGTLDVWSITLSAGASGTFTITLHDRFGGSHTTGNITIGTTTIGAGLAYNVAGLPNPGASNAANTMEGIIGTALHNPAAANGSKTYGFGSKQALATVRDLTATTSAGAGQGSTVSANTQYFLVFMGDLLGAQSSAVTATNPSGGGTTTVAHTQIGVKGGGMGCGECTDVNFYELHSSRFNANFGDGLCMGPSGSAPTGWVIINPDHENNWGTNLMIGTGASATAITKARILGGDYEGSWGGVRIETSNVIAGAGSSGHLVMYDPGKDVVICQGGLTAGRAIFDTGDAALSTTAG